VSRIAVLLVSETDTADELGMTAIHPGSVLDSAAGVSVKTDAVVGSGGDSGIILGYFD